MRATLCIIFILAAAVSDGAQNCDSEVPQGRGLEDYQERGDRCEGLYAQKVSGSSKTIHLQSFTSSLATFDPKHDEVAILRWNAPPGSAKIYLRAEALAESKLFYRMDTIQTGSSEFGWHTSLLKKLGLQASELGLYAWIYREMGGVPEVVLLPLWDHQDSGSYRLLLMLERAVSRLHISVYATSPQGGYGLLQGSQEVLPRKPHITLAPITVPAPARAGIYILQAKATALRDDGTTEEITETWFFYHPG